MIVIYQRYDMDKLDPRLAYDAESEELWGYDPIWKNSFDLVGLTEDEFAAFFDGPNLLPGKPDEDPFEDIPDPQGLIRNYPPGNEEIPDVPTRTPRHVYLDDPTIRGGSEYESPDHIDDE